MSNVLLKAIANSLLHYWSVNRVGDRPGVVLPEIARDIWDRWSHDQDEEHRKEELQAIARATPEEVRQQIAAIVEEVAADQPPELRRPLHNFLTGMPHTIRRSLPGGDHSPGPPTLDLVLRQPDDLLRFLPGRLPRFQQGDRPLGGIDLELVELLGVGGFGEVWKACNPDFDGMPPVALKFCLDPVSRDRLLRYEAQVLNQVMRQGKHPGIVPLLRTYLTAEPPCLEYEFVEGGDLTGLMHKWRKLDAGTVLDVAAKVMIRLTEIVAFAHRLNPPIVHRDLKPANILTQRVEAGKIVFRITDFGIGGLAARQAIDETTHQPANFGQFASTALRGAFTPLYASPQQVRGEPPDPRDDVYSLGVIWYQLLMRDPAMGRPGGTNWSKRLSDQGLAEGFIELLGSCFEDSPDDRPADAGVLADELNQLTKGNLASGASLSGTLRGDLAREVQRTLQQVAEAHKKARDLADQGFDYTAAVQVLDSVPEHLRDGTLYEVLCQRRDQILQLDQEIQEAVRSSRFVGLRSRVAALLDLQPLRLDMRQLLDVLTKDLDLPPFITNSIGLKLALIPAGDFLMGAPESEPDRTPAEGPLHEVSFARPIYLGIYPVTQRQFEMVMGQNPAHFNQFAKGGPDHPVENVSWEDAVEFCKRLAALPAEKQAWRIYRLPTEAEWEYACRAGTTTPFNFDVERSTASEKANFNGKNPYAAGYIGPYVGKTTRVGSYPPNAFGLYDMHGNVWEWCADFYEEKYYENSPVESPPGPSEGQYRVLRGGSWYSSGKYCRAAYRNKSTPDRRVNYVGFRIVLAPAIRAP